MRLKNQDNEEFYKKQTITLVEIPKFLAGDYSSDNSMLAQWLRVIDGIDILESLGVSQELIAMARKIAAQSSK